MALLKGKYSELPPDAVVLTERDALKYQTKILTNWKHPSDVLALKIGPYILAGTSFLTGMYVNNFYRMKFMLYNYGRVSSYLPVCVLPAFFSLMVHVEFVVPDLILQKRDQCPVCIEMRASAMQSFIGCIFPSVLGPVSSLGLAIKYATYDIPYITKEPLKVLNLIRSTSKPISNLLFAIFVGQALLASAVTHFEGQSVMKVNAKLAKLEYDLENS